MSDTPIPLTLFLAEYDVPCPNPKCGFNLRGLTGTTCPECRETLVLRVGRPDALWNMRKWVVAATTIAFAGQGLGVWYAISVLRHGIPSYFPDQLWIAYALNIGLFVGLGCALVRFLVKSRRSDPREIPRLLIALLLAMSIDNAYFLFASVVFA